MNWLTNFVKPKLSSLVKRREVPEKFFPMDGVVDEEESTYILFKV